MPNLIRLAVLVGARLGALAVVFLAGLAFAQTGFEPAPAAATTLSPWITLLAVAGPLIVLLLLAVKPMLKLADYLHAKATGEQHTAMAKAMLLGGESLARSLDHFLEVNGQDFKDLFDPAKRAAAQKHLEDAAKSGAVPALSAAADALGGAWLTGAASSAIDKALEKITPAAASPS